MHLRMIGLLTLLVSCGESTAPTEGEKAYVINCVSCHGEGAVGGLGPNITFSETAGIASYTAPQMLTLVRTGVSPSGETTCDTMTRFSATQLSDAKVNLIYGYLKKLKNDTVNRGESCP